MNTIKFSHYYYKIPIKIKSCKLIQVFKVSKKDLTDEFLRYDTAYFDENAGFHYYELKGNEFLMLIFMYLNDDCDYCIFTTLRPAYPESKEQYYRSKIGEEFQIKYK